eukprot:403364115
MSNQKRFTQYDPTIQPDHIRLSDIESKLKGEKKLKQGDMAPDVIHLEEEQQQINRLLGPGGSQNLQGRDALNQELNQQVNPQFMRQFNEKGEDLDDQSLTSAMTEKAPIVVTEKYSEKFHQEETGKEPIDKQFSTSNTRQQSQAITSSSFHPIIFNPSRQIQRAITMFNFFKSNEPNSDQYPKNQVYGRHIDIVPKGYVPAEQLWGEQKPMRENDKIDESKYFGQHKDIYGEKGNEPSFTSKLMSPFQSLRNYRRNSGDAKDLKEANLENQTRDAMAGKSATNM